MTVSYLVAVVVVAAAGLVVLAARCFHARQAGLEVRPAPQVAADPPALRVPPPPRAADVARNSAQRRGWGAKDRNLPRARFDDATRDRVGALAWWITVQQLVAEAENVTRDAAGRGRRRTGEPGE